MNPLNMLLLSLSLAAFTLAGCQSTATHSSAGARAQETFAQLSGKTWKLNNWIAVDGSAQATGAITLTVGDANRVSGNASVNRYTGVAKFTQTGEVDFSAGFASTMMMGLPDAMTRERRYLSELKQARHATLENGRLILTGDGALRLEFVPDSL
ncbi:MAG: META domain-containing protein [Verrucomicrobiales bacterium]|jgi:heat shock protein HslJ|nr:META domain-containing protein [Verrucomicrobiales bacterium]